MISSGKITQGLGRFSVVAYRNTCLPSTLSTAGARSDGVAVSWMGKASSLGNWMWSRRDTTVSGCDHDFSSAYAARSDEQRSCVISVTEKMQKKSTCNVVHMISLLFWKRNRKAVKPVPVAGDLDLWLERLTMRLPFPTSAVFRKHHVTCSLSHRPPLSQCDNLESSIACLNGILYSGFTYPEEEYR